MNEDTNPLNELGIEEVRKLAGQPPITLELPALDAFYAFLGLQFAARNTHLVGLKNAGGMAKIAERNARRIQERLAPKDSALYTLLEMGWNPTNDTNDRGGPVAPTSDATSDATAFPEPDKVVMLYADAGRHRIPNGLALLVRKVGEERPSPEYVYDVWQVQTLAQQLTGDIPLTMEIGYIQQGIAPEVLFALPDNLKPENLAVRPRRADEFGGEGWETTRLELGEPPFFDPQEGLLHLYFLNRLLVSAARCQAPPALLREQAESLRRVAWLTMSLLTDEDPDDEAEVREMLHVLDGVAELAKGLIEADAGKTGWSLYVFADTIDQTVRELLEGLNDPEDDNDDNGGG